MTKVRQKCVTINAIKFIQNHQCSVNDKIKKKFDWIVSHEKHYKFSFMPRTCSDDNISHHKTRKKVNISVKICKLM